ncbi:M91 family zinc metallopeptidase [Solirubrobacter soli]|uniref:M91 family zinc metallopeptidase n=1 Tax=Solirubrobacter soli TaxID=363832 RepID=UPI00040D0697|nr:M91 family zinc metallopeptidase [Solirubrobacter soli]
MERRHERELDPTSATEPEVAVEASPPAPANAALARMTKTERARALSAQTGGNAALARSLRTLAREDDVATASPPGRGVSTEFGEYWIVPDSTTQSFADVTGEQITETEFAALQAVWNKLKDGSGNVKITEKDDAGGDHAGFQAKMLVCFGKLLSQPGGRAMVAGLVNGSQVVTVGPTSLKKIAQATRGAGAVENPDGSAGAGGSTTIRIDADLKDDAVVAFDKDGKEIPSPVWLILGHELIHAEHNAAGRNQRNKAGSSAAWGNAEEEATIATGSGFTENKLRAEHGMTDVRFGHGIKIK